MGDFSIKMMMNEDRDFYEIMGPYLSRREIVKELGCPVWDDPGKLWFVATDESKVVGFAALVIRCGRAHFCSVWVRPEHRNQGIYKTLLRARIDYVDKMHLSAITIAMAKVCPILRQYGFVPGGGRKMKNYIRLEREVPNE